MIEQRSIIIELFLYNNNRDSPFDFKRLLQFFYKYSFNCLARLG